MKSIATTYNLLIGNDAQNEIRENHQNEWQKVSSAILAIVLCASFSDAFDYLPVSSIIAFNSAVFVMTFVSTWRTIYNISSTVFDSIMLFQPESSASIATRSTKNTLLIRTNHCIQLLEYLNAITKGQTIRHYELYNTKSANMNKNSGHSELAEELLVWRYW